MNSFNICHRDVKLENIMINPETYHVTFIDFGVSSFYFDYKHLNTHLGTAYYIAPEVIKGSYNKECDMWSLGIIAYMILTGNPPFYSNNSMEIYKTILQNKIEFPESEWKDLSKEALEFTKKLLVYDPSKRLTPLEALSHEWIDECLSVYVTELPSTYPGGGTRQKFSCTPAEEVKNSPPPRQGVHANIKKFFQSKNFWCTPPVGR
jgi:serine/threonine protein kinase